MAANIFIPFQNYKSVGGPSTFMKNLKSYLDRVAFPYSESLNDNRQLFFPIAFDEKVIRKIKKRNGLVIQRLDGIYYPSKHGEKFEKLNVPIRKIYQQYTDFVIFQSEYSKAQCFHMFGKKPEDQYELIVNGVDKNIFFASPEKDTIKGKVKFVTTGNFRNIDMIEPVVQALDSLKKELDFELAVVGPIPNKSLESFFQKPYINYFGSKNLQEVAAILRQQHIYLYSHLNPPCPNSVLEAISCGLPVVGFDSGSMAELLFFSCDLLAEVSDDLFQEYKDFSYVKLQEKILLAVKNYTFWQERALAYSNLYSFEACGKQYVNVFTKTAASLQEREKCKLFEKIKRLLYKR